MLLNSWSDDNKVIEQGKVITYSQSKIFGSWTWNPTINTEISYTQAWEYHRYCTLNFKYVGMDYDTALSCADSMVNKFSRNYSISEWNKNSDGEFAEISGGNACMAQIAVQQNAGNMYDVLVYVNEDDSKIRINSVSPSSLFTTENARDY